MKILYFLLQLSIFLVIAACSGGRKTGEGPPSVSAEITQDTSRRKTNNHSPTEAYNNSPPTTIDYAKRFTLSFHPSFKKITINEPWPGSTDTLSYIISSDTALLQQNKNDETITLIRQPVQRIVCFSTTHLAFLELLETEDLLAGFPTTNYIYSDKIKARVRKDRIKDLGPANDINFESLLSLDPDLVFAFNMGNEHALVRKMQRSGIPVVMNADYLENHPLGRAEWIKCMAAFFDKDIEADSIFRQIKQSYLDTKSRMSETHTRPSVFTGVVYGDTWFMPGGRNYGSVFFNDAGGAYIWAGNNSESILQLSFESVYEKAGKADYWIGTATYNSRQEIEQADIRYRNFKAFQTGEIYNYSAKVGQNGGNAYFEMGYARPDIILKDLAKILHPAEMKDHPFYFYQKLY
jgi:iron complex transport system substrate-binding protein